MVYSSPVKRSALGSISSILNTTPKTPATKSGGVGKSATPRVAGIRQKLANLFSGNKENSPRKRDLLHCTGYTQNNASYLDGKVCLPFVDCFDLSRRLQDAKGTVIHS
jgi:hypothetical protein